MTRSKGGTKKKIPWKRHHKSWNSSRILKFRGICFNGWNVDKSHAHIWLFGCSRCSHKEQKLFVIIIIIIIIIIIVIVTLWWHPSPMYSFVVVSAVNSNLSCIIFIIKVVVVIVVESYLVLLQVLLLPHLIMKVHVEPCLAMLLLLWIVA